MKLSEIASVLQARLDGADCEITGVAATIDPSVTAVNDAPSVTVTATDDTGRIVTASFYQGVFAPLTARKPNASSSIAYEARTTSDLETTLHWLMVMINWKN